MGRQRKIFGNKRDGFVNMRIPNDLCEQVNALTFLLDKSGVEVVIMALEALVAAHREQVDQALKIKHQSQPQQGEG